MSVTNRIDERCAGSCRGLGAPIQRRFAFLASSPAEQTITRASALSRGNRSSQVVELCQGGQFGAAENGFRIAVRGLGCPWVVLRGFFLPAVLPVVDWGCKPEATLPDSPDRDVQDFLLEFKLELANSSRVSGTCPSAQQFSLGVDQSSKRPPRTRTRLLPGARVKRGVSFLPTVRLSI